MVLLLALALLWKLGAPQVEGSARASTAEAAALLPLLGVRLSHGALPGLGWMWMRAPRPEPCRLGCPVALASPAAPGPASAVTRLPWAAASVAAAVAAPRPAVCGRGSRCFAPPALGRRCRPASRRR